VRVFPACSAFFRGRVPDGCLSFAENKLAEVEKWEARRKELERLLSTREVDE
jgi:hypothetical protein